MTMSKQFGEHWDRWVGLHDASWTFNLFASVDLNALFRFRKGNIQECFADLNRNSKTLLPEDRPKSVRVSARQIKYIKDPQYLISFLNVCGTKELTLYAEDWRLGPSPPILNFASRLHEVASINSLVLSEELIVSAGVPFLKRIFSAHKCFITRLKIGIHNRMNQATLLAECLKHASSLEHVVIHIEKRANMRRLLVELLNSLYSCSNLKTLELDGPLYIGDNDDSLAVALQAFLGQHKKLTTLLVPRSRDVGDSRQILTAVHGHPSLETLDWWSYSIGIFRYPIAGEEDQLESLCELLADMVNGSSRLRNADLGLIKFEIASGIKILHLPVGFTAYSTPQLREAFLRGMAARNILHQIDRIICANCSTIGFGATIQVLTFPRVSITQLHLCFDSMDSWGSVWAWLENYTQLEELTLTFQSEVEIPIHNLTTKSKIRSLAFSCEARSQTWGLATRNWNRVLSFITAQKQIENFEMSLEGFLVEEERPPEVAKADLYHAFKHHECLGCFRLVNPYHDMIPNKTIGDLFRLLESRTSLRQLQIECHALNLESVAELLPNAKTLEKLSLLGSYRHVSDFTLVSLAGGLNKNTSITLFEVPQAWWKRCPALKEIPNRNIMLRRVEKLVPKVEEMPHGMVPHILVALDRHKTPVFQFLRVITI